MAWNEPGGNNQDPWGNRKNNNNGNGGPPDLDEVFKNLTEKFNKLFNNNGPKSVGGSGGSNNLNQKGIMVIAGILFVGWLATGIYIIQPAERGVVTMFGKYQTSTSAGPHWHIPWPFEKVERVNVDQIRSVRLRPSQMLTKDENIVEIDMSVQYNIIKADEYLFKVKNPDTTLQQVAESAIREVIGQNNMDLIITEGRSVIAQSTRDNMQLMLENYQTGLNITAVNLESAQPPEAVQAAFSDAIKAREDQQRYINEAEAYANEIVPRANGDKKTILEQAKAYRTEVTLAAEGESDRFLALLGEYKKAPEVTRERLFLETMESVLSNSSKIVVDSEAGNNLMYLPLDKIMNQAQEKQALPDAAPFYQESSVAPKSRVRTQEADLRSRSRGAS